MPERLRRNVSAIPSPARETTARMLEVEQRMEQLPRARERV